MMDRSRGRSGRRVLGLLVILGCTEQSDRAPEVQAGTEPPGPDVYLADLTISDAGSTVSGLHNATDRPGYDNQPFFTPDGRGLLYTSQRDGQTDIYRIDLATGASHAVTRTPESEYSATPMPDGTAFSVIRVEADSAQRLWAFGFDGTPQGVLLAGVAPVGYHAWIDARRVALFVLPVDSVPITLRLGDVSTGNAEIIQTDIGRSLHRIPGEAAISFVDKRAEPWTIRRFDPSAGRIDAIVPVVGDGAEDYAWAPDGSIVMGREAVLYRWHGGDWEVLADLTGSHLADITRLAISPDGTRIAIVAEGT